MRVPLPDAAPAAKRSWLPVSHALSLGFSGKRIECAGGEDLHAFLLFCFAVACWRDRLRRRDNDLIPLARLRSR